MKKSDLIQMVKFTLFSISAGVIQVASFAILELSIMILELVLNK